ARNARKSPVEICPADMNCWWKRKMTAKAASGNTEAKTVKPLVTCRALRVCCCRLENSRDQTAKARRSVPDTRNFAMPLMNCSNRLEIFPFKTEIFLCLRTCKTPQKMDR